MPTLAPGVELFLSRCVLGADILVHVRAVMAAMPEPVLGGLVGDERFVLLEADAREGFIIPSPGGGTPVRAVVLKRRMWRNDPGFVRWVIAHELAHAHLGNRGRFDGDDPEHAADALAAEWGFVRPSVR